MQKKGLHRKNVTCLSSENGEVWLKSPSFKCMTSEKPSHFACKTRIAKLQR